MKHRQELQRYSVYDVTVNRASQGNDTMFVGGPGVLELVVYTPEKLKLEVNTYIYGVNNILLNYNGLSIWRVPSDLPNGLTSLTISFNITTNGARSLYTLFTYTGIILLTLFSLRILVSRSNSSWYTWKNDMTDCLILHNLDGYVDFITRYNGKELVYFQNTVKDNNKLELHFGDFFKGDLVRLLKFFKLTTTTSVALSSLVDFSLYNFTDDTIIGIFRDSDKLLPSNIPGILNGSILLISGRASDIARYSFLYQQNKYYKVYAITPELSRNDYVLLVVWKLDKSKDPLKQNVFSFLKYNASDCVWKRFDNDLGYDLLIPYRFTFLGYTKKHNLPLKVTDATGELFLLKDLSWADTKTLTNDYCITKLFTFGLENKQMKVLTPNLNVKLLCEFVLIYSSCWALSHFCNLMDPSVGDGTWSTKRNMYNLLVQVLTLKHNLKGIVKVHIRDIRLDLYDTYIIDNSTVQIVFMKHYKYNKYLFYVDLYTIWKEDN